MQARCPNCSTVFNTERAGVQFCPSCGSQINVPDPAAATGAGFGAPPPPPPFGSPPGAPGAPVARGEVPWEERAQRGLVNAFIENTKQVLTNPEGFWSRLRPEGSLGDPIFYAWIIYAISAVLSLPLAMVMQSYNRAQIEQALQQMKDLPPQTRQFIEPLMGFITGGGTIAATIGGIILFPVGLIIQAALTHLFCLICGAAKNGFNATLRVVGYARAPYLFMWVPICGGMIAAIWGLVMVVWGIARAQETTTTRAAMAVVVVPLLLVCCCGVVAAIAIAGVAGAAGSR